MNGHKSIQLKVGIIFCVLIIIFTGVLLIQAYNVTNVGSDKTLNYGYVKVKIVDEDGKNSLIYIRLYSSAPPTYANYEKYSQTWQCYIATADQGFTYINQHNIQLNQTTVSTKKDQNGNYNILNFSISFDQHAGYQYKSCVTDTFQRLKFETYSSDGVSGMSTIPKEAVREDTRRTANLMTTGANCGIVTYKSNRYLDCMIELQYEKESYNIIYYPNGGSGDVPTQIAKPDEVVSVSQNSYTREGFVFYGWTVDQHAKSVSLQAGDEICYSEDETKRFGLGNEEIDQIRNDRRLVLHAIWKPEKKSGFPENIERDEDMFTNCEKLEGGAGSKYSREKTGSEMAHIDEEENEGYFTNRYESE